tara:strand:+ start:540 stop:2165 length:1626 start_codon:yes stop_codon:yes gene_type:complete
MTEDSNKYVKKSPCPECGSKDNLAVYSDGHAFCFGCHYRKPAPTETKPKSKLYYSRSPVMTNPLIKFITPKALPKRGISEETAKFFNYGIAEYHGQPVQVASYEDQLGRPAAQHVRFKDKRFIWVGDCKNVQLWGQKLWRNHGGYGNAFAVITEGEIDAMSISQIQGNKFPVVSLPSGAQSANKYLAANLKWLNQFSRIVLCFDSDEPGEAASEKAIEILPAGKAAICRLPRKDANEMLLAGEGEELKSLLWKATPVRPDGILNASNLWEEFKKEGTSSICPFPYPKLDQCTRGFRKSQMICIAAGSGTGKSTICREFAHHFLKNNLTVGYIALEESVQRTMQGILAVELNEPLHLKDNVEDVEGVKEAFDKLFGTEKLFLYDHFGSMDPDRMIEQISYMATAEGVDVVILDHLTMVVSGLADIDERRAIDVTCTKLRQVVESTGIALILVSHLRRPQGTSHEQGQQVSTSDLRGSSAILQLSDLCISAERNQQGDPAERTEMQLRILKNRHTGMTGPVDKLLYDENTGRLSIPMSTYFGS